MSAPLETPRQVKYNPAFLTEDDLVDGFVVRHLDLQLLEELIDDNVDSSAANQHLLVIGPRGSGKTSLLRRVAISVKRDPERSQHWLPLVFAEESYEVTSAGELWLEALFQFAERDHDEALRATYEELRDEPSEERLRERALALLLDIADERKRRLILVVENLDMLTEQLSDDDAWKLRHTLQTEARIMVLASATSRFEQIGQANKAFYELFKVHELEPLDAEDCDRIWSHVTGRSLGPRIRPIQILTGGNARLLRIISTIAQGRLLGSLMRNLLALVDDHTEYFKSHIDALPPLERKVYLALAELWEPSTAREVGRVARVDVHKTSSLLSRLNRRGAVSVAGQDGRKKLYQLSERLYNIYYLMRRRGSPSRRVRAAVTFMLAYYGEQTDKIVEFAANVAREACKPDNPLRAEHVSAYQQILAEPGLRPLRGVILRATPMQFFSDSDIPAELRDLAARPDEVEARDREQWLDALGLADDVETRELMAELWAKPIEETMRISRAAVEADGGNPRGWARLGWVLVRAGEIDEGLDALATAADHDSTYTWAMRWLTRVGMVAGRAPLALPYLRKLYRQHDDTDTAWLLALALCDTQQAHEEAEQIIRTALDKDPSSHRAWFLLAVLLKRQARFGEAEQAARKVINLSPKVLRGWTFLAELLADHLDRPEDAKPAYERALELEPDDANTWRKYAVFLHEDLEQYEHAETAYRRTLDLDPDDTWAWLGLGELLENELDRVREAEDAYRRALDLDPQFVWAQSQLGALLGRRLGQLEQGARLLRAALDTREDLVWTWSELGWNASQREDHEEAAAAYTRALTLRPDSVFWSFTLAMALIELERFDEAQTRLEDLVHNNPDSALAAVSLAAFLVDTQRNPDEAERQYRRAITLEPSAELWAELAELLDTNPEREPDSLEAHTQVLAHDPSPKQRWTSTLALARLGVHPWATVLDEGAAELARADDPDTYNELAWDLFVHGPPSALVQAERWSTHAVETAPNNADYAHTHACILAAHNLIQPALDATRIYLADPKFVESTTEDAVTLFVELAAHDVSERAARLIRESPSAELLESVSIALDLDADQPSPAPLELVEVARDILTDIHTRRAELASD